MLCAQANILIQAITLKPMRKPKQSKNMYVATAKTPETSAVFVCVMVCMLFPLHSFCASFGEEGFARVNIFESCLKRQESFFA